MAHLLLWLEAPLQSWGCASRFSRRETESFPTMSGVLGLICCARGVANSQEDWLSGWLPSGFHVDAYPRSNQDASQLVDFHMVGSGYDDQDPWQSLMIPKTSEGKKAVGGGTKMTSRAYLQDAAFAVILEATNEQADEVEMAMRAPVWPIYLGRKCCAPTDLVFRGKHESLALARAEAAHIASQKSRVLAFHVRPAVSGEPESVVLSDVPLRLGQEKAYGYRSVIVESLSPTSGG